jgi:hypothetical protein
MALPANGALKFSDINIELGLTANAQISLGQTTVRTLYGVGAGAIRLAADGYGKSNAPVEVDPGGGVLSVSNQTLGLRGIGRTGYHNDNVNYTDTTNQGPFGPYPDALNITNYGTNISRLYRGYKYIYTTGTYRFRLTSDDGSFMWVGSNATSGYTVGNSYINNGGLHGAVTVTGGLLTLTEGLFYPIRIVYGNSGNNGSLLLEWEGPGQAWTSSLTNRVVYNSATNGY